MSRPLFTLTAGVLLLTAAGGGAQESKPYRSTAQERLKAFAWFDGLGYPDVRGLALVRAATGSQYLHHDRRGGKTWKSHTHGFLLEARGETFTVLTLDLDTRTFTKTKAGATKHARVDYEPVALAAFALDKEAPGGRTESFVLAWACARNGLEREAAQVFDRAASSPNYGGVLAANPSFLQTVIVDLAIVELSRALTAFADTKAPRTRLLEGFERVSRVTRDAPDCGYFKEARAHAEVLRRMIAEDAEHAKRRAGKPFERLSKSEQIADLIFRLRDETTLGRDGWDHLDVHESGRGKEDSPAHQLVRLGYDAIPQLIDAMEDKRFARAVCYDRRHGQFQGVLTVGECVQLILPHITGRHSLTDRAAVEAWHKGLLKKGEKQVLIEGTAAGDGDSPEQARRLLTKYPKDVLPAVIAGARAAQDGWTRAALVQTAGEVPGDGPLAFLLDEVRAGPLVSARVAAARALHGRGRPEGVAAMIAAWHGRRPDREASADEQLTQVAGFLAHCGKVEAIEALAKDLHRRPVGLRAAVVREFDPEYDSAPTAAAGLRDDPKQVRAAAERLLIAALNDREKQLGLSIVSKRGNELTNPRVCDLAGDVLSRLDPKRYAFDLFAPLPERDRAIAGLRSAWRKANGLPPPPWHAHDHG